jgi:NADH-quinone oxidoreductase subunit K
VIPLEHYLAVGTALFVFGAIGFLTRRNLIVMFLCAEMMLQGVAVVLVSYARYHGNLHGQVFTLFIVTVAACEAAVALALILMVYRYRKSLDVSLWSELREPGLEPAVDEEPLPPAPPPPAMPRLPAAGVEPTHRREDSCV